jgi:methylmalonyl-CoA/ethylmalonyl-CoA epimerase
VIDAGLFHRLGIAVRGNGEGPSRWFADTLGAKIESSMPEPGDSHLTTMLQLGPTTVALFTAALDDTTGTIGRYIDRYGAGLHSLAWRVSDLEGAETRVRERGLTVTGINREARHWFLHPKETCGILIELTDQDADQPRRSVQGPGPVREIAWMTAVVENADAARALFEELLGATVVPGLPAGPPEDETTLDLAIGDVVLRLVQPRSEASRYAASGDIRKGLHSFAVRVDDLDKVPSPVVDHDGQVVWTDPAQTLGLRLEWTTQSVDQPNPATG